MSVLWSKTAIFYRLDITLSGTSIWFRDETVILMSGRGDKSGGEKLRATYRQGTTLIFQDHLYISIPPWYIKVQEVPLMLFIYQDDIEISIPSWYMKDWLCLTYHWRKKSKCQGLVTLKNVYTNKKKWNSLPGLLPSQWLMVHLLQCFIGVRWTHLSPIVQSLDN